jgi:hypothetical protein
MRFKGVEIDSYTNCGGQDRMKGAFDARTVDLACTTATPNVCTTVASYLGKNLNTIHEQIESCKRIGALQESLLKQMNTPEYKKAKSENNKELSQAYYDLVRPSPDLKSKILDSKSTKDLGNPPEKVVKLDPKDDTSLWMLAIACGRLNDIQGKKYFSPPTAQKNHTQALDPVK